MSERHDDRARACPLCGAELAEIAGSCASCGARLAEAPRDWSRPAFERALADALRPAAGAEDSRPRRGSLTLIAAAARTLADTWRAPNAAFSEFRREGGVLLPSLFLVVVASPSILLATALREDTALVRWGHGRTWWPIVVFVAMPLVYVYVRAQLVHLSLVFSMNARSSFEATYRVVAYAQAAAFPVIGIPFAGDFLFLLAGTVFETSALCAAHSISLRSAVFAEIVPALILALCLAAGFAAFVVAPRPGG